ncbi:MAG: NAD(P)H-dependent oxidoreductase [Deltaproteobacteria bacterium]|nr:NAD(P)H-dependent oxidoreductase [Deltaproteobacteria bacterium]
MKELVTPYQVMEALATNLGKAYAKKAVKAEGTIQFHLRHEGEKIDCYVKADENELTISPGVTTNPTVALTSTLYHWLDLAAKRLNPIIGVISGKLKFKGDTSFFARILPDDIFNIDISPYADPVTAFEKNPHRHWTPPKNVFVINASPRTREGYTDFFVKAFLKGLESEGARVQTCYLSEQKINRCTGCWHCWLSGTGECIFKEKDDFEKVYAGCQDADLIVFAFPLYCDGVPGALKDFFDRAIAHSHPFMIEGIYKTRHPRRITKPQAAVVFSVCGFIEMENFQAVREHLRKISHNAHLPIVAEIFRSGAIYLHKNPLLYQKLNEVLLALEKAGEDVAKRGKVSRKNLRIITQKIDKASNFQKMSNYFWNEKIQSGENDY